MRLDHQAILVMPMENAYASTIMMATSAIVVKLVISSPQYRIPPSVKVIVKACS